MLKRVSMAWLLWSWAGVVALIAFNRGIDLLWGVLIVLIVAIFAALWLPGWQLRGVTVTRTRFPSEGVVGQPLRIAYRFDVKGWPTRFGVEIHDRLSMDGDPTPVTLAPVVRAADEATLTWTPTTRGAWRLDDIELQCRYPLGLTCAKRVCTDAPREIVIYPRHVPLRLQVDAEAEPNYEQTISRRRHGRDEFYGVREYRPGDEVRAIHWRAMARRQELVVKEYEHQQDRRLWIFLDLSALGHAGSGAESTLEYMVTIAHSAALHAQQSQVAVGMYYLQGNELRVIDATADTATYLQLRDALARVRTEDQSSPRIWMAEHSLPNGGTWLLFNVWQAHERAELIGHATRSAAKPMLVEFDTKSFLDGRSDRTIESQRVGHGAVYRVSRGADLSTLFATV